MLRRPLIDEDGLALRAARWLACVCYRLFSGSAFHAGRLRECAKTGLALFDRRQFRQPAGFVACLATASTTGRADLRDGKPRPGLQREPSVSRRCRSLIVLNPPI